MKKKKQKKKCWCAFLHGEMLPCWTDLSKYQVRETILNDYHPRRWEDAEADGWEVRRVKLKEL